MTTLGLHTRPGRCEHGFAEVHHPDLCNCAEFGEWVTFLRALRDAAVDGKVSQTRMRPLIAAIPHKHRGQLYRRAVREGLIEPAGKEPSTDEKGGNTDKEQRVYRLRRDVAA